MRRLAENLALLAGTTLVMLLLAEGGLRLLGFQPAASGPDRTIGFHWRPGARYTWRGEGASEGLINGAGWRDRDYPLAKPPGTTRILFLGDSFVEALQVPLDSTFHKRLERLLEDRATEGRRFEVPAMGLSGSGTTQEYLMYRTWGRRYDPDVVVVLFILNDWSDNWIRNPRDPRRPYFLEEGDSLRLDTSFVDAPDFKRSERAAPWKRVSALVTLATRIRNELRVRARPTTEERGLIDSTGWFYQWNFHVPPEADSIPAFRVTGRILARFADQVRRDGRRFVVVEAGGAEQVDSTLLAEGRRDPTFDPEKTRRWLAAEGARRGFDVVSLTPAFRAAATTRAPLWYGRDGKYGHWNSRGHAVAAQALAESLAARLPGLAAPAGTP